jgi:hypothetical protein
VQNIRTSFPMGNISEAAWLFMQTGAVSPLEQHQQSYP